MTVDPNDPDQGVGGDGTEPTGTPTPGEDSKDAEIRQLKQENAQLREDKRAERARALGAELHLPKTLVDILKTVPADQIEEKARALAAELGSAPTPPTPPPAGEAPAGGESAGGTPPPDPSLAAFDNQPGGDPIPGDPSLSWQDEMRKEIDSANTLEDISAIQQKYRDRQRAASRG